MVQLEFYTQSAFSSSFALIFFLSFLLFVFIHTLSSKLIFKWKTQQFSDEVCVSEEWSHYTSECRRQRQRPRRRRWLQQHQRPKGIKIQTKNAHTARNSNNNYKARTNTLLDAATKCVYMEAMSVFLGSLYSMYRWTKNTLFFVYSLLYLAGIYSHSQWTV